MHEPREAVPILVKLGGSLITDKSRRSTPRPDVLARLADETEAALRLSPSLRLILGHGSGSFGHWEASKHHTRDGVATPDEWQGFARVSAAALALNRIVTGVFSQAGVPVMSLQPSALGHASGGQITHFEERPIRLALDHGLVPLVFGDVAFDDTQGGTILSTEDIFVYLASRFSAKWLLLLGNAPGVLGRGGEPVPLITPESYPKMQRYLSGSENIDVTGGMGDKVAQVIALVERCPELRVRIMGGTHPGSLREALTDPAGYPHGTCIQASAVLA